MEGRKLSQKVSIKINEQPSEIVKQNLGLCLDEELSWKYNIDQVTSKISKLTGVMAKARYYLSVSWNLRNYGVSILNLLQYHLDKHVANQA